MNNIKDQCCPYNKMHQGKIMTKKGSSENRYEPHNRYMEVSRGDKLRKKEKEIPSSTLVMEEYGISSPKSTMRQAPVLKASHDSKPRAGLMKSQGLKETNYMTPIGSLAKQSKERISTRGRSAHPSRRAYEESKGQLRNASSNSLSRSTLETEDLELKSISPTEINTTSDSYYKFLGYTFMTEAWSRELKEAGLVSSNVAWHLGETVKLLRQECPTVASNLSYKYH
ncbi:unnamed protein product [Moneuplotes crassus]|uniref:Uncharacterized protein n=1 Tax=Euplotes crassus TaxID=5936 RepID=A0AAD1XRT8_EUPCR|nr:unnamed protein product [Moneuplotes crassus]